MVGSGIAAVMRIGLLEMKNFSMEFFSGVKASQGRQAVNEITVDSQLLTIPRTFPVTSLL